MIRVVIFEDEIPARKKLKRFLEESAVSVQIIAEIDTVAAGIPFLHAHKADLIFSDIELLDGNSFEIYSQVKVNCPIIFTTAYDQFWMNAFEVNGIDYLLKPFSQERFEKAMDKFGRLGRNMEETDRLIGSLSKVIADQLSKKNFKKRFVIHHHQGMYFLDTAQISFFEANEGVIFAWDVSGKKHLLQESTLKEIEEQLSLEDFFRINRSELIHKPHIEKIEHYNKNSLAIKLKGHAQHLLTSQQNTAAFRTWIEA